MMYKDEATELLAPKCGKDNFIGFCAELAEKLAKEANFTYEICLVGDSMYGSKQDNGTWNGMIGELVRSVSGKRRHFTAKFRTHFENFMKPIDDSDSFESNDDIKE